MVLDFHKFFVLGRRTRPDWGPTQLGAPTRDLSSQKLTDFCDNKKTIFFEMQFPAHPFTTTQLNLNFNMVAHQSSVQQLCLIIASSCQRSFFLARHLAVLDPIRTGFLPVWTAQTF